MTQHYRTVAYALEVQEAADANAIFDTNAGRTDLFTQYLTFDKPVKNGALRHIMILCDSANNRTFDLIFAQGAHADNQAAQGRFIFDSQEVLEADIADNTLENFYGYYPFVLETEGRLYLTLYAAAGAFGDVLGRIAVWADVLA